MKKSKSWVHVCVRFLLLITLAIRSYSLEVNPVTDDIYKLSTLKQNIPKDYKIPVRYIPKQEGGMCWVELNVFALETSLQDLAHKFGSISTNKNDLRIFILILQDLRLKMGSVEMIMYDFECHYRDERWQTEQYFDFITEFLTAARNTSYSDNCDPPPCPSTPYTEPTEGYIHGSPVPDSRAAVECLNSCSTSKESRLLPEVVERSLLSLLFIPLLALVFLLVWKIRSRRNQDDVEQNLGESGPFTGTEETTPPLDTTEKNKLHVVKTV
ncbi:kit ligand a isoform X2 [Gouania willdenowi]|uniref:Kit ligand n=1 Tax=Gouania willdenowi TaxID=441366 RepID=A0A8C5E1F6_GOUWI|nr:kit ligand isoform X2 [Gouania willdenowi]